MTPGLHHNKKMIRAEAKGRRSVLSSDMQEKGSALMTESLLTLVKGYPNVMVYASKPFEVDTHYFISSLMERGQKVVVPIIEKEIRTLRLFYLGDPSNLVRSTFNVP
jgi:5-formyltetrahydrofolate cyclo-ligase